MNYLEKDIDNTTNKLINSDISYNKSFNSLTKIIDKKSFIKATIKKKFKKKKYIFLLILIHFCFLSFLLILVYKSIIKNAMETLFPFLRPIPFLNIYTSTHRDFDNHITSPIYKIVCDDKSQLKQEYNLSIIETNKDNILYPKRKAYGEMSKMYYIWKLYKKGDLNSKYVGFNYYGRFFPFKDNIPDLDEMFKNYDAIVKSRYVFGITVREHFYDSHIGHFLNETLDIIKEKFPEYYQYSLSSLEKTYANLCNVFIMKKDDFIKWGEFVFGVLIELDRRYKLKTDKDIRKLIIKEVKKSNKQLNIDFQSRLEFFLSERIGIGFYERHFKKVYEIPTLEQY